MVGYDATLWALLVPTVVACFQVQADATLCRALQARYGDQAQIIVVLDGGAAFAQSRRGIGVPPQPSAPAGPQASRTSFADASLPVDRRGSGCRLPVR